MLLVDFDYEFAREAVELKMGAVVTKSGKWVILNEPDSTSYYPINGYIPAELCHECWTTEGKYSIGVVTEYDLVIEVYNEVW